MSRSYILIPLMPSADLPERCLSYYSWVVHEFTKDLSFSHQNFIWLSGILLKGCVLFSNSVFITVALDF